MGDDDNNTMRSIGRMLLAHKTDKLAGTNTCMGDSDSPLSFV